MNHRAEDIVSSAIHRHTESADGTEVTTFTGKYTLVDGEIYEKEKKLVDAGFVEKMLVMQEFLDPFSKEKSDVLQEMTKTFSRISSKFSEEKENLKGLLRKVKAVISL